MATGRVTTFAVGNHEGRLYNTTPEDHPFLSMLGGLYGGEPVGSIVIPWQEHSLRDASIRARAEGADAQTAQHRARTPVHNVLQIIQETVDVSYTKQATSRMLDAIGSNHPEVATAGEGNPVGNELAWQVDAEFKSIGRDVEYALLNGSFTEPADNNSERQTRGIVEATTTNHNDLASNSQNVTGEDSNDVIDATAHGFSDGDKVQFTALTGGSSLSTNTTFYVVNANTDDFQIAASAGGTALDFGSDITATSTIEKVEDLADDDVVDLLQDVWSQGGIMESETATVMANGWNKRRLTQAFITDGNYRELSRNVGGVNVQTIETDFGRLNVVLNRYLPSNTVQVVSLEECKICWLATEKGKLFVEPLSKDGARERVQIYGEFGLRFGNELKHGKLTGLSTR